ncbi:MAG: phosphonate metabolism transcriptional regulator PhnF [Streptosporangiales bacterium]|nr:phosphonate metabolism transcriptional regulator PhnF [Streptosporangiales bacterium]
MATNGGRPAGGYSAWRLIAEELRREISGGGLAPGTRLPAEGELATRFGVHRNTVRHAIAALAAENLVLSRRGSGTFVAERTVLVHRIGARTRLSDSAGGPGRASVRLLEAATEPEPPAEIAGRLALDGGAALRLETVGAVDGTLISRATHWFPDALVPGLAERCAESGSVTVALRDIGIGDYVRASTTVAARHASADEAADLDLPTGSVLLVTRSLDVLPGGAPLQAGVSRFVASRVELDVGAPGSAT